MSKQRASRGGVKRALMREQAMGLRLTGLTYRDIGRALATSHDTAHKLVNEALDETRARTAEETERYREQELRRADVLIGAHWAKRGDPAHAKIILAASERRSKLLGLDAPIKLEPVRQGDDHPLDYSLLATDEMLQLRLLMQKAKGAVPVLAEQTVDVTPAQEATA